MELDYQAQAKGYRSQQDSLIVRNRFWTRHWSWVIQKEPNSALGIDINVFFPK